jgi:hypothetical protein
MSLTTAAILQGYDQNILQGATITSSVAPLASYSLDVLGYGRPDMRVKFGTGTVTIHFALTGGSPSAARGDILVIPMSNLADTHVTLTNDDGFSQNIPVPGTRRNGLPKTIVVDLSVGTPLAATRTSAVWHLVIAANPVNVTLGGAIMIYSPKTALTDRDFQWGYTQRTTGAASGQANPYLTRSVLNLQTSERSIELSALATDLDADALEAWCAANNGGGFPGLLWLSPEIEDAYFGLLEASCERVVGSALCLDTNILRVRMTELSKGIPIL